MSDDPRRPGTPLDLAALEAFVENARIPLALLDAAFTFVRVNRAYADACRMPVEALAGRSHFALFPHAAHEAAFERARASGRAEVWREAPFEFPGQPERGTTFWDWTLTPVPGPDGVAAFVLAPQDVTEKVLARRRLEESEQVARVRAGELEAVLDAVPAAIFFARDREATRIDGNAYSHRLVAVDAGGNLSRSAPPAERPAYRPFRGGVEVPPERLPMQVAARDGVDVRDQEFELRFEDGRSRWIVGGATPVRLGAEVRGAVGAFVDITERKQLELERERHLAEVAEANRAKDVFFNTLSHELRTPLAAIANAVRILRSPAARPEQVARMLELLDRNVRRQTRLVDDALDLTRIMRGAVEVRRGPLDLREVVAAQLDLVEPLARSADLALSAELPAQPIPVLADADRFGQVIANLLTNALKYTPAGGWIRVTAAAEGAHAVVRVQDCGIGMTPAILERIFEPFWRGDDPLTRARGGLGIGLAIARSLAAILGATLEADSDGPGKGSTFTLRASLLPRSVLPRAASDEDAAAARAPRRVLVVEDNGDLRETLVAILQLLGHVPAAASNGRAGLDAIRGRSFDAAVVDIGLPDIEGFELARVVRSDDGAGGIRLVALTGYGSADHRERARTAGFDAYFTKPVDVVALDRALGA